MATIKAVSSKCGVGGILDYVTKEEKTEEKLLSGKDCQPETVKDEMQTTKELWGKTGGRTYKHFVQSFHKDENITPEQAHEIAKKFAEQCEQFKGFEVLIATHKDREHIHTHFVVNSVSHEDGHKFRMHKSELQQMKDLSDQICSQRGLHICEKGKTFEGAVRADMTSYSKEKYQFLLKAEKGAVKSFVLDTAVAVMQCKAQATSREDFITRMAEKGYETKWKDNVKNVTFTDKDGNKVRNSNIEKTFKVEVSKEKLEDEFKRNRERADRARATRMGVGRTGTEHSGDYTRTNNQVNSRYSVPKTQRVGSGADESRERTAQADISRLHEQLQQIRGIDNQYNPKEQRKRDEELKRAEQVARAEAERARQEAEQANRELRRKQLSSSKRSIENGWER